MNYMEFVDYTGKYDCPIILVEGTRSLPEGDRRSLVALGERLAKELPNAIFRTGNAEGSDEAFAEGIKKIDPTRLQYVLPYPKHRKMKIEKSSYKIALAEIPYAAEERAVYHTKNASPEYISMLEKRDKIPMLKSKSRYILRDTIKVIGATEAGLAPAIIGIFYENTENPMKGGTGHTIRVCKQQGIPVILKKEWMNWYKTSGTSSGYRTPT